MVGLGPAGHSVVAMPCVREECGVLSLCAGVEQTAMRYRLSPRRGCGIALKMSYVEAREDCVGDATV